MSLEEHIQHWFVVWFFLEYSFDSLARAIFRFGNRCKFQGAPHDVFPTLSGLFRPGHGQDRRGNTCQSHRRAPHGMFEGYSQHIEKEDPDAGTSRIANVARGSPARTPAWNSHVCSIEVCGGSSSIIAWYSCSWGNPLRGVVRPSAVPCANGGAGESVWRPLETSSFSP